MKKKRLPTSYFGDNPHLHQVNALAKRESKVHFLLLQFQQFERRNLRNTEANFCYSTI